MKKLSIFFLFLIASINLSLAQEVQDDAKSSSGPMIAFEESSYDFGQIVQGDKVEHIFAFKNTGTAPLVLSDVLTTCGCTAPQWNKEPIQPGQSDSIKIIFNSAGKMGKQNKIITIVSNSLNGEQKIALTGMVNSKEKQE